jgi:hypothetical protein
MCRRKMITWAEAWGQWQAISFEMKEVILQFITLLLALITVESIILLVIGIKKWL